MTQKRERKYSGILNRIDYYVKQADSQSSIDDLDDLIMSVSSKFYFKDASARTISMFNVSGEVTQDYLFLQDSKTIPMEDTEWGMGATQAEAEKVARGPSAPKEPEAKEEKPLTPRQQSRLRAVIRAQDQQKKKLEKYQQQHDDFTKRHDGFKADFEGEKYLRDTAAAVGDDDGVAKSNKKMADLRGKGAKVREDLQGAKGRITEQETLIGKGNIAIASAGGKPTPYPGDEGGAPAGGDEAPKDEGDVDDKTRQILGFSQVESDKVADQFDALSNTLFGPDTDPETAEEPATGIANAIISSGEHYTEENFPEKGIELSDEQAGTVSIKYADPKDSTKGWNVYRHVGVEESLLNKQPIRNYTNAYNAAKDSMFLGGMARDKKPQISLGSGTELTNDQEVDLVQQISHKLRSYRKKSESTRSQWGGRYGDKKAKLTKDEKDDIIGGALQQATIKGSPVWEVVHKGKPITNNVLSSIGDGLARQRALPDASMSWWSRMKAGYKEGHRKQMEFMHGAMPKGDLYDFSPQKYWEERGKLATQYARANAEFDREFFNASQITNLQESLVVKNAAWDKFVVVRDEVTEGAIKIGATLENVQGHVQRIKDGSKTVLPPAAGFPTIYGGAKTVRALQGNFKQAGLTPPAPAAATRIPQKPPAPAPTAAPAPVAPEVPVVEPQERFPEEGQQLELMPQENQQLALNPNVMAVADQPPEPLPVSVPAPQQMEMPMPGAEGGGENVAAAGIVTGDREYLEPGETAPKGVTLHSGLDRKGKKATFYSKKEAKAKKVTKTTAPTAGPKPVRDMDTGLQQEMRLAGENEMAAPMDDYKQAADVEEAKAKRSQSKSKIRTARANARMAKARANEAEAKASRSEAESGAKIAHMLEKLDREIIELTAHTNPKVSAVLSRLEKAIDSKHKVPATTK